MNSCSIREAAPDDFDALVDLFDAYRVFYCQPSDSTSARQFLRDRLERKESRVFVAARGHRVVGFTQLYPSFSSVSLLPLWILYDLYVAPDARKTGAGEALLRRAQDFASETGAEGLILETAVDNLPAQRLYEKLGWRRDTAFHRYFFAAAPRGQTSTST